MKVHADTHRIAAIDPDRPADVEASYQIELAARAADVPDLPPPCRYGHERGFHHPWPGDRTGHWLGYVDDEPAGTAELTLPTLDNTDNALISLAVHPRYRRRGVGRALLAHVTALAAKEGRQRVMTESVQALPGGPPRAGVGTAFGYAMGGHAALHEVRRRLDVSGVDWPSLDSLADRAWPRAQGYSLVRWRDRAPQEYVEDVAYLDGRLAADAPMGDLAWRPEKVDASRVRAGERVRAARGSRVYATGARHDATGRLVALTAITLEATIADHAWQQITLVEPGHRGHRLGLLIKIENLRYTLAEEPSLASVDTWNAAVNDHMISINEAVGFRPVDRWISWQRDV